MASVTLFLALLLSGSALHKAFHRERLSLAAGKLTGLPRQGHLVLVVAGTIELAAALCLLAPGLHVTGALLAAALWAGYAGALAVRYGQTLDCGCDLAAREKPVGRTLVARPALLALLAVVVAALPPAPIGVEAPFAAAGLLALYLAVSELLAIPLPRWRNA